MHKIITMNNFDTNTVEKKIRYVFKDKSLLTTAFVHSSYAYEHNVEDNERLEYLGDAVLDCIVADYLYHKYPNMDAGQLSKARASIVSSKGLKKVVRRMGILEHLMMSGNASKNISKSKKMEANLFEALLCAVYFDSSIQGVTEWVLHWIGHDMDTVNSSDSIDYKSRLQEICHHNKQEISYQQIDRSGPDNNPLFVHAVIIDGCVMGEGQGKTIKQAQMFAAKVAYEKLKGKE